MTTIEKNPVKRPTRLEVKDALMVVAAAASTADGRLHGPELTHLRMLVYLHPLLYKGVEDVDRYIGGCRQFVENMGWDKAVRLAASRLTPGLRETAYAWAVDIVYSDRKQKQSEHVFLRRLRVVLGIHGRLAGKVKAVTAIQNRVA